MSSFHKTLISAMVKSLLRGKSLIQAVLEYCFGTLSLSTPNSAQVGTAAPISRSIQDFLKEAEKEFVDPVSPDKLEQLSAELKAQFLDRLQSGVECMLPSYSHRLPTGDESGRYLALDVGGSTLRVALVELSGRKHLHEQTSKILSICNFVIGKEVKDLEGTLFFDWMAARIIETLSSQPHESDEPLPMAIAWSFPIEQTALGAGKLQSMGKGFVAHKGLMGRDLGELIAGSCKTHGLNVEVAAIVNDSTACLLSEAFFQTSTRFGLILGTGVNIAAYLPVNLISRKKFGTRPDGWFDRASHVIVNTELGMFGYGILPVTRWDQQLLDGHSRPDFQPLEHMVSGMYLGEVARFALIEAIETTGIFGGLIPPSLSTPYSLGTETLSMIASDTSEDLASAKKLFSNRHPSSHKPTFSDIAALKSLASFISLRSSALVATCVSTLWDVRRESNQNLVETLPKDSTFYQSAHDDLKLENTTVAFNGSVIEHYPGYLESCQRYIDELSASRGSSEKGSIKLVPAKESSLLGTAVASACV